MGSNVLFLKLQPVFRDTYLEKPLLMSSTDIHVAYFFFAKPK